MANDSESCRSEGINTFTFQEQCRVKSDGSFAPTKEALLKIHPDRNLSCKDDAKEKFNMLTEKCNKGPTDTTPAIWSRIPATTPSSRYKGAFPSGMSQAAKNYISRSQGAAYDPFIDDPHKDVREDSSNVPPTPAGVPPTPAGVPPSPPTQRYGRSRKEKTSCSLFGTCRGGKTRYKKKRRKRTKKIKRKRKGTRRR